MSQLPNAAESLTPAVHSVSSSGLARGAAPMIIEAPEIKRRRGPVLLALAVAVLGTGGAYVAGQRGMGPFAAMSSAHASMQIPATLEAHPQNALVEEPVAKKPAAVAPADPPPVAAIDPASLPTTPSKEAPVNAPPAAPIKGGHPSAAVAPPTRAVAAAAAPVAAPVAKAVEPAAPVVPSAPEPGGLAGAIKKAAGPTESHAAQVIAPEAPAARNGDIPEVPATGAIQGALGSMRGAARSCVAGQDGPSRANITFNSTGKVQSVSVSGPAAGTAAEGCIRNAFSKASVGPFRKPSFSFSTTITPP